MGFWVSIFPKKKFLKHWNCFSFFVIFVMSSCMYLIKEDEKFIKWIFHLNLLWVLTSDNYFPIIMSQQEFEYDLFAQLPMKDNCRSQLFIKFIRTQKRHPTSLDEIAMLTWRLLLILSQFFLWTKPLENFPLATYLASVTATSMSYTAL